MTLLALMHSSKAKVLLVELIPTKQVFRKSLYKSDPQAHALGINYVTGLHNFALCYLTQSSCRIQSMKRCPCGLMFCGCRNCDLGALQGTQLGSG